MNREEVLANGVVSKDEADKIVPVMTWSLDGNYLMKNDLMILNISRTITGNVRFILRQQLVLKIISTSNLYFQLEGLTYRIVPIRTDSKSDMVPVIVNTNIMYNNVMTKFAWGNMKTEVYLDENNMRMTTNFRINFSRLAEELMNENKRDSAIKVLDKCLEVMPDKTIPGYFMTKIAELCITELPEHITVRIHWWRMTWN